MAEIGQNLREQVDKEARLKSVKERQNEERQKKLEEIKAQALAAQRFKEQKEEERRRRIEDLKQKDDSRRVQVEEKRRAIDEAEKKRFEYILKKNQEREQRIEIKKRNERSNAVFAFGSSTPRNLEPVDPNVSFWGQRKATSIQNISSCATTAANALTRRQSERELDVGNKKRATSATGLERAENAAPTVPAGCASGYLGRRRTDLVPTVPSSRDSMFNSSRKSLNHSPGRAYSMTRLDQLAKPRKRPDLPSLDEQNSLPHLRPLSSSKISSFTRSMSHLAVGKKPSPTGNNANALPHKSLNKNDSRSMHHLASVGVHPLPRATLTSQLREQKLHASTTNNSSEASSRPSSSLSHQSTNSVASSVSVKHRISTTPRKRRPISIAVTGISADLKKADNKPPLPKPRKSSSKEKIDVKLTSAKAKSPVDNVNKEKRISSGVVHNVVPPQQSKETQKKPPDVIVLAKTEDVAKAAAVPVIDKVVPETDKESNKENVPEGNTEARKEIEDVETKKDIVEVKKIETKVDTRQEKSTETQATVVQEVTTTKEVVELVQESKNEPIEVVKPLSVTETVTETNVNITENSDNLNNEMTTSMTKSRITTEEEAKAAIAEKRRLIREEAERQAELERQRREAEAQAELERQQREEEQIRQLIELQKHQEEERLREAILETQRREEEERLRNEEEQKLKLLKEEAEKKAREDAERQKAELQERLKNEEKEREARRKRVEAIMLRTRGKNNANLPSQQLNDEKNDNKAEENKDDEENKINGTKIEEQQPTNGTTKNGKDSEIVDNITESEMVKNANNKIDTITSTDALNSNNSWRESQQCDSLM